jgi:hypothetical protein
MLNVSTPNGYCKKISYLKIFVFYRVDTFWHLAKPSILLGFDLRVLAVLFGKNYIN